MTEGTAKTQ